MIDQFTRRLIGANPDIQTLLISRLIDVQTKHLVEKTFAQQLSAGIYKESMIKLNEHKI